MIKRLLKKPSKKVIIMGSGIGLGVIQGVLTRSLGKVPWIEQYLPENWSNWSSIGNIIIGGVAIVVGGATKLAGSKDFMGFITAYGVTLIIVGIVNGLTLHGTPLMGSQPFGPSPYMGEHVGFQDHKAKGFGAVLASPKTTVPYNEILF